MVRVIKGLALLMVLAGTGGCSSEAPSARVSAEEEAPVAPAVETPKVASRLIQIRMKDDMTFEPENPVVAVGDTVIWINIGAMPHTATDDPGRAGVPEHNILPAGAATWDSGLLMAQGEFRAVFDTPGEYTYLCTLHEVMGMVGRVTVE